MITKIAVNMLSNLEKRAWLGQRLANAARLTQLREGFKNVGRAFSSRDKLRPTSAEWDWIEANKKFEPFANCEAVSDQRFRKHILGQGLKDVGLGALQSGLLYGAPISGAVGLGYKFLKRKPDNTEIPQG